MRLSTPTTCPTSRCAADHSAAGARLLTAPARPPGQDLVEDYVERNQDDFEEFEDVAEMYECLNLDALSAALLAGEVSLKRSGRDSDDSSMSGASDDEDAEPAAASPAPARDAADAGKAGAQSPAARPPAAPPSPVSKPPPAPAAALPVPPRPAPAEAVRRANPVPQPQPPASPPPAALRSVPVAKPPADKPVAAELRPQPQGWGLPGASAEAPQSLYAPPRGAPPPPVPAPDSKPQFLSRLQRLQQGGVSSVAGAPPPGVGAAPPPGYRQPFGDAAAAAAAGAGVRSGEDLSQEASPAGSASVDLRLALEGVPLPPEGQAAFDPATSLRLLEASFRCMPQPSDSQLLRRGRVRNLVPVPPSFPVAPAPVVDNPALFARLDLDALFFAFYFQQGSVQQLLAARELKRSNWRFHKKHNTWFARAEEPKVCTDEHEQGAYVYFDFTADWCQRSRPDFTFEFQWLE